jgi:hypothetical protein
LKLEKQLTLHLVGHGYEQGKEEQVAMPGVILMDLLSGSKRETEG